jgi:CheY-like chemotaxis protein
MIRSESLPACAGYWIAWAAAHLHAVIRGSFTKYCGDQARLNTRDIAMPDSDEFELIAQNRSSLGNQLRIVALTGHADDPTKHRCTRAGFDGFLAKPASVSDLEAALKFVSPGRKNSDKKRPGNGVHRLDGFLLYYPGSTRQAASHSHL